jgi:uncharacterized protein YhaN
MILHSIELEHVGPFRESMRLGPFAKGLNVLAAPNESGKSTAIRATARALFDKHTTKSEDLKALQPAGTDLAPRVAVEFETGSGKYRIEKTFLSSPRSHLWQWERGKWQLIAEADAADNKMQSLLQSTLPGRGATKPEHWGLLGFLWARQGELADWPSLDGNDAGLKIRHRLARVELDPAIEQLREHLASVADALITPTGKTRERGDLAQVEEDLARIQEELSRISHQRESLDALHKRYHEASAEVLRLENECREQEARAKALSEQAKTAERLKSEWEAHESEFHAAKENLQIVAKDAGTLAAHRTALDETKLALEKAGETARQAEEHLARLRHRLEDESQKRPKSDHYLAEGRSRQQRIQNLLKLRQLESEKATLEKCVKKAEKAASELQSLAEKKAPLPEITAARLQKLEQTEVEIREIRAQVQALGLTVQLTPDQNAQVRIIRDGVDKAEKLNRGSTQTFQSPQSLDLHLEGWGKIWIRSGAKEAQNLTEKLGRQEQTFQKSLLEAQVSSLQAAREALERRNQLDLEIKTAQASLDQVLSDDYPSLDKLKAAHAAAERKTINLLEALGNFSGEQEQSRTELEEEHERLTVSIAAATKELKTLDAVLEKLRAEEKQSLDALHQAREQEQRFLVRQSTLQAQIGDLLARYATDLEAAKDRAQQTFVEAEARVKALRDKFPPDYEKLPERNKRMAASLEQIKSELQLKRSERDNAEGALKSMGGQGLYSRETELLENQEEAILRRDAARTKAWAARIGQSLIEFRKQAATKAVLAPLEERLGSALAGVTGVSDRKVFLDESLQISGLGRSREASHAFDHLSQGTKEQLLLCLRIAVAQELAKEEEPQILILDDVLVNTDPVRQERVLDVLAAAASHLQILVLTCHPERYRGAGMAQVIETKSKLSMEV